MFGLGIKEAVIIVLVLVILYGIFARPKAAGNGTGRGGWDEKPRVKDGEIEEQ